MQTTLIIIGGVVLVLFVYGYFMKQKMKNTPLVEDHEKVLKLTDANFKHQTKNKLVLIDFWASWCAPCRMMAPVLNDVSSELNNNGYVGKVNVEESQALASQFGVRSIPTLVLLKNGKEVNRFVGIKSKEFLLKEMARFA